MREERILTGLLILVVDDNQDQLCLMTHVLESAGARVLVATGGADAIKLALESAPDAVLLDCMLAGMSGTETLMALRGMGFRRPVIAVSASVMSHQIESALAAGFDTFLAKPFRLIDLIATVAKQARTATADVIFDLSN